MLKSEVHTKLPTIFKWKPNLSRVFKYPVRIRTNVVIDYYKNCSF